MTHAPKPIIWIATDAPAVTPDSASNRRETISRDRWGRIILPRWDFINAHDAAYPYTDSELDALLATVRHRKIRWTVFAVIKLTTLLALLITTFVVLPAMALQFGLMR